MLLVLIALIQELLLNSVINAFMLNEMIHSLYQCPERKLYFKRIIYCTQIIVNQFALIGWRSLQLTLPNAHSLNVHTLNALYSVFPISGHIIGGYDIHCYKHEVHICTKFFFAEEKKIRHQNFDSR